MLSHEAGSEGLLGERLSPAPFRLLPFSGPELGRGCARQRSLCALPTCSAAVVPAFLLFTFRFCREGLFLSFAGAPPGLVGPGEPLWGCA